MASGKSVTGSQERVFATFVEKQGDKPFRRQQLAEALRPHTSPRSLDTAGRLADIFIQRMRGTNQLAKAGHVHWKFIVPTERTLKSGRTVSDMPEVMKLDLSTRCPQKWAAVDLETGQVWMGSADGWKRADATIRAEVSTLVNSAEAA